MHDLAVFKEPWAGSKHYRSSELLLGVSRLCAQVHAFWTMHKHTSLCCFTKVIGSLSNTQHANGIRLKGQIPICTHASPKTPAAAMHNVKRPSACTLQKSSPCQGLWGTPASLCHQRCTQSPVPICVHFRASGINDWRWHKPSLSQIRL